MKKLKYGSKTGLKYFTYDDIQSWNPCYDSSKYISTSWKGTAIDILNMNDVPFQDRLWVVLRTEICSEKLLRLAAVWFYRDTLKWIPNPDPRSLNAADVSERYAYGQATEEELKAAEASALAAERSALSAALAAQKSAWWTTQEEVSWSAARSAALAAQSAETSVWSAEASARLAAKLTERPEKVLVENRYRDKLIEMWISEGQERVAKK